MSIRMQLYGHVAHFPDADPAHQILSATEPREWRRPMGHPRSLWLHHVDWHLKELGMGQASALGMARRRPLEYRQKVDAATCCSGACSHTWPELYHWWVWLEGYIAQYLKKLWTDLDETWWTGWVCNKDKLIRFWWKSGSRSCPPNFIQICPKLFEISCYISV